MKKFWDTVFTIAWKDILAELRTKDTATSTLVFALMVIVTFNFAFDPDRIKLVAAGVLWVAIAFAGVLSLNRSFTSESDKGCLEGLMLSPVDREAVFLGKMLGSLTFMLVVEVVLLPLFSVLYNFPILLPKLALVALLATVGFACVGTLFSALAVNTRAREVMLPLLFFPMVTPIMIAAVKASEVILERGAWGDMSSWIGLIAAFDVVFLVVSSIVFEYIVEE